MQIIQFIITGRTHAASEPSDEGEESPSPAKPKSRGDI
jgi:hypothetical protein